MKNPGPIASFLFSILIATLPVAVSADTGQAPFSEASLTPTESFESRSVDSRPDCLSTTVESDQITNLSKPADPSPCRKSASNVAGELVLQAGHQGSGFQLAVQLTATPPAGSSEQSFTDKVGPFAISAGATTTLPLPPFPRDVPSGWDWQIDPVDIVGPSNVKCHFVGPSSGTLTGNVALQIFCADNGQGCAEGTCNPVIAKLAGDFKGITKVTVATDDGTFFEQKFIRQNQPAIFSELPQGSSFTVSTPSSGGNGYGRIFCGPLPESGMIAGEPFEVDVNCVFHAGKRCPSAECDNLPPSPPTFKCKVYERVFFRSWQCFPLPDGTGEFCDYVEFMDHVRVCKFPDSTPLTFDPASGSAKAGVAKALGDDFGPHVQQLAVGPKVGLTLVGAPPYSGRVQVVGSVSHGSGVSSVSFDLDDLPIELENLSWNGDDFAGELDTTQLADGEHLLGVMAINGDYEMFSYPGIRFDTENDPCLHDITAPTVTLTSPVDGTTWTEGESVTLTADASDNEEVTMVQFFREDGVWLGSDSTAPYSLPWSPVLGATEIRARAWDACENTASDTSTITVEPAGEPTMTVRKIDDTLVSSGDTLDWGTLDFAETNNRWGTWRIPLSAENESTEADLVTSMSLIHTLGSGFSIGLDTLLSPLPPSTEDFFQLRLDTEVEGQHQARLEITHNDPEHPNPFVIHLTGTVRAAPQFQARRATNVLDSGEVLNIGTFGPNSGTKNRAITVENLAAAGASGLEWGPVEVINTQGSAFTWSGTLVTPLAPGEGDNFALNFSTDTFGTFRAVVQIYHEDLSLPSPHQFIVEATVQGPQATTFDVSEDAWVEQLSPNVNYGTRTTLETRATLSQMGRSSYLKLNVFGVSGTVQSAKLRIRAKTFFPSARMYWISSTSWSETGITWNNAPLGYNLQRELGSLPSGWIEIDVTDIVTSNGLYTLGFTAADQPGLGFYSRESVYPPSLEVTYQP